MAEERCAGAHDTGCGGSCSCTRCEPMPGTECDPGGGPAGAAAAAG
ncbi:MAG: hypothetical protein HY897_04130 [Deltaproteobacteria bacterium]|nr:hypothetical protein [Deltaproteobacteria bacterium]